MRSLKESLARAKARRAELFADPRTTAFRVVNAHADSVPDVTVDYFDRLLVMSTYRSFSEADEAELAETCMDVFEGRSLYLKRRPKEARVVANTARADVSPATPLRGEAIDHVEVLENGLRFDIRPGAGLSVGLFLDMRDIRAWLFANANDKRVLNTFAYTCGFGVTARAAGAMRAVNIDISRRVLDWGEDNHRLNQLSVERRDFIAGDVFDWLGRFHKKGEQFDVVVLDPPSFATTEKSRFTAARDYPKLVRAALSVLPRGGVLLACCNLASLDAEAFADLVTHGFSLAARRPGKRVALGPSPVDFPADERSPHRLNALAVHT
ncbi:MAG: class I SAM-dependent rRNA methyltransferase [Myxococcaceae bacterium]